MAKRKILENWKAIEEKEKQINKERKFVSGGFSGKVFPEISKELVLVIPFLYKVNKSKNAPYKAIEILAEFCPFTGKPLYEEIPDEEKK